MALNSRAILDPRWLTHNRPVQSGFFTATIDIFNPSISEAVYDAVANTWSGERDVVWTGKARIQPNSKPTDRNGRINPTSIQEVEVHIDFTGNTITGQVGVMPDIRPNFQIFVTDSPADSALESFIYNVRSVVNSSTPWHRVLICEVDQEASRG